jgi:hypothetical protein
MTGSASFAGGIETFNATFSSESIDIQSGATAVFNGITTTGGGTLSGGTLSGSGAVTVTGPLTWAGGTMTGGATTSIEAGALLNITGTGVRIANRSLDIGGQATLAAGGGLTVVANSANLRPGGVINMADNVVMVDYPASFLAAALSPAGSAILTALTHGYNGGTWTGAGINSSVAAVTPGTGLGFAEATDLFTSFPATFAGRSIDATTVLVRYTYGGDANLDDTVNLTDFTLLAANFNKTGRRWSQGDFNYDGTVDLTDFTMLAANFNKSLSPTEARAAVTQSAAPAAARNGSFSGSEIISSNDITDDLLGRDAPQICQGAEIEI